ncbi:MAG: hypothetical protein R3C59_16185 [Planctomycetaceae bacterium]
MLTDFYGNVLVEPTDVEHDRSSFQLTMLTLKNAIEKRGRKDVIVAVEMTGIYHKPPMQAFRKAGFERASCIVCVQLLSPAGTR